MSIFLMLLLLSCVRTPSTDVVHLKNGMTLLLQEKDTPISSAVVLLPYGSAHGPVHLAALMSNTLLRGTEIRTGQQLHEEIESMGGRFNIETDLTQTLIWIQAPSAYFNDCFYLLCETLAKPSFDGPEIGMVYERLLKESSRDYHGYLRTRSWIDDKIREQLFLQSSLARNRHKVSQLYSKEACVDFYHTYLNESNLVFALVGDVDRAEVMENLENFWPGDDETSTQQSSLKIIAGKDNCPSVQEYRETKEPSMAYLAVRAPARLDSGCVEAHILNGALTLNHPNWRSHMQLPSDPNNPIQLKSRYQSGDTYGYLYVGTQRAAEDIEEVQHVLTNFIRYLQTEGIEEEIFEIAKRHLLFDLLYGKQFSLNEAIQMALYYGIDQPYVWDVDDAISRVETVTLDDMNRMISHYLKSPCTVVNQSE